MAVDTPAERKIVSVLFCDIAGSYTFLYDNDPEQGKLILDKALAEMVSVIERFGGVVNQVQGDGVMSLFGAPLAYEDHARRACSAALELVDTFKKKNANGDWPEASEIEIRIGISTGEAVVGTQSVKLPTGGESSEYFATGAVSHLAGRLQKVASSYEIVISDSTAAAIGGSVQTQTLQERSVHELIEGHAPPLCLLGFDAFESPAAPANPFVGREVELRTLRRNLADVKSEQQSRTVIVCGDPGLGKTRLIEEFLDGALSEGCQVVSAQANSVETHLPFALVNRLLLGWFPTGSTKSDVERADLMVDYVYGIDADNWALQQSIRDVLGLSISDQRWLKLEPDIRRGEIYRSLLILLSSLGTEKATVVVVEDLHWADHVSRQLLESIVTESISSQLLLVVTTRNEPARQGVVADEVVQLQPLAEVDSRQLLASFPGLSSSSPQQLRDLLRRCGGVPLFIEQIGISVVDADSVHAVESNPTEVDLSPAIRSLIDSRIDQLPASAKKVLSLASVAGTRFNEGCLLVVMDEGEVELQQAIAILIEHRLVEAARGYQEYRFCHALYQEVAYMGILKSQLPDRHSAYLAYFKRLAQVRGDSSTDGHVHYHALNAQQWADVSDSSQRIARAAMESGAYNEAVHYFEQSLQATQKLIEQTGDDIESLEKQNAELLLELSRACIPLGDFERSYKALDNCQSISHLKDTYTYCESFAYRTALAAIQKDAMTAVASGEEAVRVAEATGSDRLKFGCQVYYAEALFFHGDFERVTNILQALVDAGLLDRFPLDRIGNTAPVSIDCYGILGMAYAQLGEFDEAEKYGRAACASADQTGKSFDRGLAYFYLTYILVHRCKMDEAEVELEKVLDVIDAGGVKFLAPWVGGLLGFIYAKQGQLDEAEELVRSSIADSQRMSLSIFEVYAHVSLSFVQMQRGDYKAADETLKIADRLAKAGSFKSVRMWIKRSMGISALQAGNIDTGIVLMRDAIDDASRLGMRPDVAHCHAILGGVVNEQSLTASDANPIVEEQLTFLQNQRDIAEKMYSDMGMVV